MEETVLFAFYGSLRRGMANYIIYSTELEFLGVHRINGFALYALEDYPYAVKSADYSDSLVVEIFRIKNIRARQKINQLELEAGYIFDQIEIKGQLVGIYLFDKAGKNPKVMSGDWVEFFGKSANR